MGKYDDMLHMEHPTSKRHPRMSLSDRAAQFSPFAALTGHNAAIRETARLTDSRIELAEDRRSLLNDRLQIAAAFAGTDEQFSFTYFVPDGKKDGGSYRTCTGAVRKIDPVCGFIELRDRIRIPIESVTEVSGSLF